MWKYKGGNGSMDLLYNGCITRNIVLYLTKYGHNPLTGEVICGYFNPLVIDYIILANGCQVTHQIEFS